MSDLHFEQGFAAKWMNQYEKWPLTRWPVKATYLILAGDIGRAVKHFN